MSSCIGEAVKKEAVWGGGGGGFENPPIPEYRARDWQKAVLLENQR